MQLSPETGPPLTIQADLTDKKYEQSFPDPTDDLLHELNKVDNSLPLVAPPKSVNTVISPSPVAGVQAENAPTIIPQNSSPTKSHFRRQSAPPAELTPTRLRPRIVPSKIYDSTVAESANAQRTQPPKLSSPSPPIPSQICAMSMVESVPLPPNSANVAVDDDPFQIPNAPQPQLNHGPYLYGTHYWPPQQMITPYATSYPQGHGFPPMNMPHYGHDYHSQYGEVSNYGPPTGIQHGPLPLLGPAYPHPHFQHSSNHPYFGAPGKPSYPTASHESTTAPHDVSSSLIPTNTSDDSVAPNYESSAGPALQGTSNGMDNLMSDGTEE